MDQAGRTYNVEIQRRDEGTKYGQVKTIRAFMDDLGIPFEQAMKAAKIPESDWLAYKKLLEGMGK